MNVSGVRRLPKRGLPSDLTIYSGTAEQLLRSLDPAIKFDLIISSPPYNIGKPYEQKTELALYLRQQSQLIDLMVSRLSTCGSICWQTGNYVQNGGKTKGRIFPLDFLFVSLFQKHDLQLRNRIIWHFGHGLHCKHRFSGRYETILWYTKSDDYIFNLDDVRIESKYPGKTSYKGPNKGHLSGNPMGKNPEDFWVFEDVWDIPNIKGNHIEKTTHPCQFPIGLVERLILALSRKGGLVFDPYAGVASTGVAAALHERKFLGAEIRNDYSVVGKKRMLDAVNGKLKYRSHDTPIYDPSRSKLSQKPTR
jgi:adenine-specific DNA-methyltransferase